MVLDASVILKWFMQENLSDMARLIKDTHLRGDFTITIPDIAIYEVGNALRYEPEFSPPEIERALTELYDINLDIIAPLPDMAGLAAGLACQSEITFYDAFYLALAKELGLQFVTADERLYSKVKDMSHISLLSSLAI